MQNKLLNHSILLLILNGIISCTTLESYKEVNTPVYLNNKSTVDQQIDNEIEIVSFNIKNGTDISFPISELSNSEKFGNPDVFLLQEVDENSVIKFSEKFGLNYLYYPASSNEEGLNFGNAVLSKFAITSESKLILPHQKSNGRIRNATNCILTVNDKRILVYSIHNATVMTKRSKRMEQVDKILDDIKQKENKVDGIIVGGDFNTLLPNDKNLVADKFRSEKFSWATSSIGFTAKSLGKFIKTSLDHVFVKNLEVVETDKLVNSNSSDHIPILVRVKI